MTNDPKISALQTAFAGGAAGAITRAVAQPLDVLKIRFQLQLEPIRQGSKYSSVLQATSSIVREEGLRTLWSGHIPAQFLSVSYGIVQFSAYEQLLLICQQADEKIFDNNRHAINFTCGSVAATAATVVSFPFDTVRTRLIAEEKTHRAYKGFIDATVVIIRTEGFLALFKGLVPTLGQIGPYAGVQFSVYKFFTENILTKVEYFQRRVSMSSTITSTLLGNVIAGSIAGFVAKTVVYPFDLVKKRLQIQGFQNHRTNFGRQMYCDGLLHCVRLTVSQEGVLSLYKGYVPSMLKAVFVTALHFTVYDEIKHLFLKM